MTYDEYIAQQQQAIDVRFPRFNGRTLRVLAGKAAPKVIRVDKLNELLKTTIL